MERRPGVQQVDARCNVAVAGAICVDLPAVAYAQVHASTLMAILRMMGMNDCAGTGRALQWSTRGVHVGGGCTNSRGRTRAIGWTGD